MAARATKLISTWWTWSWLRACAHGLVLVLLSLLVLGGRARAAEPEPVAPAEDFSDLASADYVQRRLQPLRQFEDAKEGLRILAELRTDKDTLDRKLKAARAALDVDGRSEVQIAQMRAALSGVSVPDKCSKDFNAVELLTVVDRVARDYKQAFGEGIDGQPELASVIRQELVASCEVAARWCKGEGTFLSRLKAKLDERDRGVRARKPQLQKALENGETLRRATADRIEEARVRVETLRVEGEKKESAFQTLPWIVIEFFGFAVIVMLMVGMFPERVQREWLGSGQAIQLMTVSILVISILGLGLAGILRDNSLGALLGGVAGYVLSQGVGVAAESRRRQQEGGEPSAPPSPPAAPTPAAGPPAVRAPAPAAQEAGSAPESAAESTLAGPDAPTFPASERILLAMQAITVGALAFAAYRLRVGDRGAAWALVALAAGLFAHGSVRIGMAMGRAASAVARPNQAVQPPAPPPPAPPPPEPVRGHAEAASRADEPPGAIPDPTPAAEPASVPVTHKKMSGRSRIRVRAVHPRGAAPGEAAQSHGGKVS